MDSRQVSVPVSTAYRFAQGGTMKRMTIALAAAVLVMGIGTTAATGGGLADFYRAYLAEKRDLCAGKCGFLDSRSEALRQYAETSLAKAEFLKGRCEHLVEKMIEADIGKRPHKIDCFIILEFQNFMRQKEMHADG
ncbi:MAG: hypothetical protein V2L15_07270 [Desulfobacteraceae bacterium]|nr:hypothetical protein [Desulfobacteraceae bacterium]